MAEVKTEEKKPEEVKPPVDEKKIPETAAKPKRPQQTFLDECAG